MILVDKSRWSNSGSTAAPDAKAYPVSATWRALPAADEVE